MQNISTPAIDRLQCLPKRFSCSLNTHVSPHQAPKRISNVGEIQQLPTRSIGWINSMCMSKKRNLKIILVLIPLICSLKFMSYLLTRTAAKNKTL
jgi:hypothetical protein